MSSEKDPKLPYEVYKGGVIRLFGKRVVVVPADLVAGINENVLKSKLGLKAAQSIRRKIGFEMAFEYAKNYDKSNECNCKVIMEDYLEMAHARGWGDFFVEEMDLEKPRVVVRIENSLEAESIGKTGSPSCQYWVGGIAGILKHSLEKCINHNHPSVSIEGREDKCVSKGDEYCEVVVEKVRD
ncbi:MAG: 4-vinyl reductase [Candidatus Diapherotrites archaeon]|nr:4-vinyl reductase [Candidatus Diapherotrites archaeon]